MNQTTLEYLKKLLAHLEYYNLMAPFPVFDTEYVEYVKILIMDLENEKRINYDEQPVVACKYCNHLHIVFDEHDNDICMRCGSVNELREFKNINEYNTFIDGEKA